MIDDVSYIKFNQNIRDKKISYPSLHLDLSALDQNIKYVLGRTHLPIRIATKSLRSLEVIQYILNSSDRFQGLMCYSLAEALWLRERGMRDLLVAYPCVDPVLLDQLAKNPAEIILMVDSAAHLQLIGDRGFQIAIDIDMSTTHFGVYFGVQRSSLKSLEQIQHLLQQLKQYPSLKLTSIMGYEAQIAGVADKSRPLMQILKKLSSKRYLAFRKQAVQLVQNAGYKLTVINGGGSGSLELSDADQALTEITVGSAFYAPTLFDQYQSLALKPALFYALPIVRNPKSSIYTCFAGGFVASGAMGRDKYPQLYAPQGARFLPHEGAGEVQTPIAYSGPLQLKLGDCIFMRHAKAGEVCERFDIIHAWRDSQLKIFKTYRGSGVNFS